LKSRSKYNDERRTNIDMTAIDYIEDESLIPQEDIVITMTNKGYIKRITTDTYRTQNRGGVGVKGITTNDEDFVDSMITMTTHDYLMFFTNKGKAYRIKGYEVPLYNRQAKGLPIVNLLPLEKEEIVKAMLKLTPDDEYKYIVFCTQNGIVKRTDISEFDSIRKTGKIAITLKDNDELVAVKKTKGEDEILIAASNGRMTRFSEKEIRVMGRSAGGVKGLELDSGKVIGCEIAEDNQKVLVITENGYGKQTDISEYRLTHRGSKGVKALNITDKNGNIVAFKIVLDNQDLMISTNNGILIRIDVSQVSTTGRVAQGVRLINLKDDQKVATVALINHEDEIRKYN
jgi:DNA gyrase subunit A